MNDNKSLLNNMPIFDGSINISETISPILVAGEQIEASAIQHRLFAIKHRRDIVVATSGRCILMKRGLIGGYNLYDVRWQDVKDVSIRVGVFGADIRIEAMLAPDLEITSGSKYLVFTGLRKDEAQAVYRICQGYKQAWREKRRLREIEEMRAKSGGFDMGPSQSAATANAQIGNGDAVSRLQRAKEMLDKGLIADSEFETIKARIIGSL